MPLYFFYTMVQKSQKWPKTQIKGGSCLKCLWKDADQEMKVLPTWCDTYYDGVSEAIQVRPVVSLASQKGFFLSFRASSGIGIQIPSAIRSACHWQRRRESTLSNALTNSQ